jgi:gamma-glutamyl-gamma-aminobutyraldehyde dehydrogenase/4-guanidinobutyraldehyde dehydrogenase/NAD-dependent aldehyde dehydrogenase
MMWGMATTAPGSGTLPDTSDFRRQAFVDGAFTDAASGATFACVSPVTGETLFDVAACDTDDVDRAVAAARRSFEGGAWSRLAPRERRTVLLRLADLIERDRDRLATMITLDMGKPIGDARGEVSGAVACFRFFAEAVDKVYGEVGPTGPGVVSTITREPIGVVGLVVPWNYPILMPTWKLAPALATGNSVVLKPAEQSPIVALALAELTAEAGIPEGVVNVLPGMGETAGQAIGRHMDVDKVAFTGSSEVGKFFLVYAGQSNMKSVQLECGGKSPNVVFADVPDLDLAVAESAEGIFGNSGQVCSAGSRLLVQEAIADEFLEKLAREAAKWLPGDPLDPGTRMGSLVDETQMDRVLGYIETGRGEGAEVRAGGVRAREETGGFYVEPTIFGGARNDMRIAQEEIFGPVVTAIPFASEADGIRIANDTIYGLTSGVWTRDINKAYRFARSIRSGTVCINCYDRGDNALPFGGFKQSGIGRDKSLHALENYTQLKTTYINVLDD